MDCSSNEVAVFLWTVGVEAILVLAIFIVFKIWSAVENTQHQIEKVEEALYKSCALFDERLKYATHKDEFKREIEEIRNEIGELTHCIQCIVDDMQKPTTATATPSPKRRHH